MKTSDWHPDYADPSLEIHALLNGIELYKAYTPRGAVWYPAYFEPYRERLPDLPPRDDLCPHYRGLLLWNRLADRIVWLGCNKYACKVCGKRRRRMLRKYLEHELRDVTHVRMWTFTLTSRYAPDTPTHYAQLRRAWKLFTTQLRRSRTFDSRERAARFITIVEQHKSGFYHLHVLVDRWIDWYRVQVVWERCAQTATGGDGHCGHCNVKWLSRRNAVRYVVKYVTKASATLQRKQKRWTRSRGWSAMREVFPKQPGQWVIGRVSEITGWLILKGEETISQPLAPDEEEDTISGFTKLTNWYLRITDRAPP